MPQVSPPKDPESFRRQIGLPDLVTAATVRILYVAALLTPDWRQVFGTVYGRDTSVPARSARHVTSVSSAAQSCGVARDVWTSVHEALAQANFHELPAGSLEESSAEFKDFSTRLHKSMKLERLDRAKLAEVYLMAHQPGWPELLSEVLPEARYDTKKVVRDFARRNRVPDRQSLVTILSCMK